MADPFLERATLFYQQSEVKVTKSMIHVDQFILKKWNSFRDSLPYDVALKLRRKFWPRISLRGSPFDGNQKNESSLVKPEPNRVFQ